MSILDANVKIAIVGAGSMGGACLKGWLADKTGAASKLSANNFVVVAPRKESRQALTDELGIKCVACASELPVCDIVLLAVKPQIMFEVLSKVAASQFAPYMEGEASRATSAACFPLFVSVAAGIETSLIEAALQNEWDVIHACADEAQASPSAKKIEVVRVMPNMPLKAGAGASAVAGGKNATDEQVRLVADLFAALGFSAVVDESQIDAVCAISGGAPAYFALVAELLARAGVKAGLDEQLSSDLARASLVGCGAYLAQSDVSCAQLRRSVCSPGGTTLAAIDAMTKAGLEYAIPAGVDAAISRAKELAKC
jgi:pyrroline-5-carboxylate reductase